MNNLTPFFEDPFWTKHEGLPDELRPTEHDLYAENDRGWRLSIQQNLPD